MNKKLIELANYLDAKGLRVEADMVDDIIKISNDDLRDSEEGDGVISIDVDIDAGEVRDLQYALSGQDEWPDAMSLDDAGLDWKRPGLLFSIEQNALRLKNKLTSLIPKSVRGWLNGLGPNDPLEGHRAELEEAILRYVNKNYEDEGVIESINWGWSNSTDTYSYDVIIDRPTKYRDDDYREHWAIWIGKLDEDIYYGATERIEGTNYHLAGEW